MEQAVLQMNHVNIAYEQECVVKDFSIQVQPGEILGIVGGVRRWKKYGDPCGDGTSGKSRTRYGWRNHL